MFIHEYIQQTNTHTNTTYEHNTIKCQKIDSSTLIMNLLTFCLFEVKWSLEQQELLLLEDINFKLKTRVLRS